MPDTLTLLNTLDIQFNQAKPLLQVKQVASQSVPNNTITTVTFDTVIFDSHSGWSNSTHVYTVSVPGWYWASVLINFQNNATGIRTARLNTNGTGNSSIISTSTPNSSGNVAGTYFTGPTMLHAGDTIKVETVQTSGGALGTQTTGGFSCVFSLDWMHR